MKKYKILIILIFINLLNYNAVYAEECAFADIEIGGDTSKAIEIYGEPIEVINSEENEDSSYDSYIVIDFTALELSSITVSNTDDTVTVESDGQHTPKIKKYGRDEANRAVMLGFVANIAVMITLLISIQFKPSNIAGSALEVHNAISTLAGYSPIFVIGSLTAYLISQTFDVWFFHKIKSYTGESKLWLRNNLSTITSQLLDTMIYQFTWVLAGMDLSTAFIIAVTKYVFKVVIAGIDTIFIYWVRKW